jgi:hypothetical protein
MPPRRVTDDSGKVDVIAERRRKKALLKTGALQNAILTSANFSNIATEASRQDSFVISQNPSASVNS